MPASQHAPRLGRSGWVVVVLFAFAVALTLSMVSPSSDGKKPAPDTAARATYTDVPISFERNRGQTDARVRFTSRGSGYALFLTRREAVLSLTGKEGPGAVLRMRPAGANPNPGLTAGRRLPARSNYAIGKDPKRWRVGVANYGSVRYSRVYPGVDLVYHGKQGELEYDFVVSPGADPGRIALDFQGQERLALTRGGELELGMQGGPIRQQKPFIYQELGGARRQVAGRYVLRGKDRVGFAVGSYDRTKPLVIDPVLGYSRYLGGSGYDFGNAIAADGEGSVYVTGFTASANFPTAQPHQGTSGGQSDAFLTKLDPQGALVYSTYFGGLNSDGGAGLALEPSCDRACSAYVTGFTGSPNLPVTAESFDQTYNGATDAFAAKFDPQGRLAQSTYLGGAGDDRGLAIAVDLARHAHVTGASSSLDYPTKTPYQANLRTGASNCGTGSTACPDAFVTKLDPLGRTLTYSTYLGGVEPDEGNGIAVDSSGNAVVAGEASTGFVGPPVGGEYQSDFPTTSGAHQREFGGSSDAFLAKLTPGGSLDYSTYLGGSGADSGEGVALDGDGKAYVAGIAYSGFPTTAGSFQPQAGGDSQDAFVAKLEPDAAGASDSDLAYSTYLGGDSQESSVDIAVNPVGEAFLAGGTSSSDFPTKNGFQSRGADSDAFVSRLAADGASLVYSSYLGGDGGDGNSPVAVARDSTDSAYVIGSTNSTDFPNKGSASQFGGGINDAFVASIVPGEGAATIPPPAVISISPAGDSTLGGVSVTITGTNFTGATAVRFGDTPAAGFNVDSEKKVTAVAPPHAEGIVDVTVTTPQSTSRMGPSTKFVYGFGAWKATGSPQTTDAGIDGTVGTPTATVLSSGKVLLVRGTAAELYDPEAGTWIPTAGPALRRGHHTATLLSSPNCGSNCGKVLVTGDFGPGTSTATTSAELFDPAADGGKGAWTRTADLKLRRFRSAATLLPDGKILVAGGCPANTRLFDCTHDYPAESRPVQSAEIYDPATGQWALTTTPPRYPRAEHTATLLAGAGCGANCGKVLLLGGVATSTHGVVVFGPPELYDPATQTWSTTNNENVGMQRYGHTATQLDSGKVLLAAGAVGESGEVLDSSELYDPAANAWQASGTLILARSNHVAAPLPGGSALIFGGFRAFTPASNVVLGEFYDPSRDGGKGGFGLATPPRELRAAQTATLLSSDPKRFEAGASCGNNCGKVLIVERDLAELYTPPPAITAITPATGAVEGGTPVVIEGRGFTHGVSAVRFGDVAAQSFKVDSYSRLTAVSPGAAAGTSVPVTVVNEGGRAESAARFTYAATAAGGGPPAGGGPGGEGSGGGAGTNPGAGGGAGTTPGAGGAQLNPPGGGGSTAPVPNSEARRVLGLRGCLNRTSAHTRREQRLSRRGSPRARALAKRHLRRHGLRLRRRCVVRWGRTPGRVTQLTALALSSTEIELSFRAPGTDHTKGPAARAYLVKQSTIPIRDGRGFRRARALCNGACRFRVTEVGEKITLRIADLRPRTTYYYAIAARDNVSRRLGPRSLVVRARTR